MSGNLERLGRLTTSVDPNVEMGYHPCFGDFGHSHLTTAVKQNIPTYHSVARVLMLVPEVPIAELPRAGENSGKAPPLKLSLKLRHSCGGYVHLPSQSMLPTLIEALYIPINPTAMAPSTPSPSVAIHATTFTAEAFAPFGTVASSPLSPSTTTLPTTPPVGSVPANQGTALKYSDISPLTSTYRLSPSGAPAYPTMNLFSCFSRQLCRGQTFDVRVLAPSVHYANIRPALRLI